MGGKGTLGPGVLAAGTLPSVPTRERGRERPLADAHVRASVYAVPHPDDRAARIWGRMCG